MRVAIFSEEQVRRWLSMTDCIDAMERAFRAVAQGKYVQPLRIISWQPDKRGAIAAMPGYLDEKLGAKLISVFPQNRASGRESHQGLIALFDTSTGELVSLTHAGAVTAIRTAAVSGLATRLLANEGAFELAILGSGTQAEEHLRAMQAVRPIRAVRVWSRTREHAQEFAARRGSGELPITVCETARDAVAGAHIVCTVTAATEPVLEGRWLSPGTHINAVGASVPPFRELDCAAVTRSRVFVDMRDCALEEADELREPLREGLIRQSDIAELAEMVSGACTLRSASDEITLFKSVGMAVEDLAAAGLVYERAMQAQQAAYVDF